MHGRGAPHRRLGRLPGAQGGAAAEGRYIGIGVANFVKGTGRGPFEIAMVRIGPSGKIMVYTGVAAIGQGTRTMLAQIVAEQLGGAMDDIDVVIGDTGDHRLRHGGGPRAARR